jgi:hypothetical protein
MLAIPGELPAPSEDGRWAYEMKWDGVCVIGYVQDGTTRLMSRNDLDVSVSYPEVLDAPDPIRQRSLRIRSAATEAAIDLRDGVEALPLPSVEVRTSDGKVCGQSADKAQRPGPS